MAFISSSNTNSGKYEVPTVQGVSTTSAQTASVQVSTASTDVAAASLSYDTVCAFIATQPNGSQIKYEDITQIDDDDIEEMDIKWNLALLSMRADRFWKKTGKKITIQGSDVADRGKKESYNKDPKVEEPAPKAMIAIDGIGWDWSYMVEEDENHALVADEEEVPTEYALMAKSSSSSDNESLLKNQRLDKDKKGLGFNEYSAVPPPPAQVYSPPKKDLSWMGLPEFVDDTVTDYSRPTPSVDVFVKETGCPSVSKDNNTENPRKPTVKYAEMYRNTSQSPKVRSNNFGPPIIEDWDSDDEIEIESTPNKTDRPSIELVQMNQSTREIVEKKESSKQNKNHPRGNQRNWNNQKSQQLGKDFVMQNKACYNCGSFEHLKFDCKQNTWVNKGKTWTRFGFQLLKQNFPLLAQKVPTAKPTDAAVKGNRGKAVKASA
ncbi:ribonuclease H-like domain-containing protein, partial [Tanacetum coccineum]